MTNRINNKLNHYQAGATLTEAIYVLPIFFIIIFGMMEMTYIYKAKNTLNLATSEAVRKGALNNAHLDSIQNALSEGMAALYATKTSRCPGVYGTLAPPGLVCATFMQSAINASGRKAVTILSPSKEIFDEFKKKLKTTVEGDPNEKKQFVIPNDNLKWRSPALKSVKIGGVNRGINIQDANLLKIKTFWCQKLSVPGLDLIFYNTILKNSTSPEQIYCNMLSLNTTAAGPSARIFGQSKGYYIAIRSQGIARMQSPVHLKGGNLLTSDVIENIIDPDIPPVEPPHECDPNTETCPPPEECDPNTEICPPPEECDPNTETCPPPEECDPTTETCPEECPENHIPNPSPLAITKCIADPVYCSANPADSICPCDKTEQNSSPVPNFTPIGSSTASQNNNNDTHASGNTPPAEKISALPSPAFGSQSATKPAIITGTASINTGLGNDVDKLISKSPTLTAQIKSLLANKWTIKYGEKGSKNAFADKRKSKKLISLPEAYKSNASMIVQLLSHEAGHASYNREPSPRFGNLTKAQYVEKGVIPYLKDEGAATLNNIKVQREILANTAIKKDGKVIKKGVDIKIAGGAHGDNSEIYNIIYDKIDTLGVDKAREKAGRIFANHEKPSGKPYKTYYQYYQSIYINHWDKYHVNK